MKGQKLTPTTDCPITSIRVSSVARGGDSLITNGAINGKNCIITLDTGANRTIVRKDLICGGVTPANGLKLQTATGDRTSIKGKKIVNIRIGRTIFQHEVLIADIMDEVILGMDFMRANGFVVDVGRGVLSYSNIELPLQVSSTGATTRRIIVDHREKLPPNSETIVWGRLEGGSGSPRLWVVEANEEEDGAKEIIIGKVLVKPDNDYRVPIRTLNLSDKAKTVKKGAVIGKCEEVSTIVKCEQKGPIGNADMQGQKEIVEQLMQKWTEDLTEEQKNSAHQLLERYMSIFCSTSDSNGRNTLVKHRINTGTEMPIRQAPRRLPLAKQEDGS